MSNINGPNFFVGFWWCFECREISSSYIGTGGGGTRMRRQRERESNKNFLPLSLSLTVRGTTDNSC